MFHYITKILPLYGGQGEVATNPFNLCSCRRTGAPILVCPGREQAWGCNIKVLEKRTPILSFPPEGGRDVSACALPSGFHDHSRVTRNTSSRLVAPARTQRRPSSRIVRIGRSAPPSCPSPLKGEGTFLTGLITDFLTRPFITLPPYVPSPLGRGGLRWGNSYQSSSGSPPPFRGRAKVGQFIPVLFRLSSPFSGEG